MIISISRYVGSQKIKNFTPRIQGIARWIGYIILTALVPVIASAQSNHDSLVRALTTVSSDTAKIYILCDLSEAYSSISPDTGLKYGLQALSEAERIEWKPGIQRACINIGNNYRILTRYDSARVFYDRALSIADKAGNKKDLANIHNAIGMQHRRASNYPEALRHLFKALALFEELGKKEGAAMCYGNIGIIYDNQKDWGKALEQYTKALQLYRSINDKEGVAINLTNLANLYLEMGRPHQALPAEEDALGAASELRQTNLILINLANIGTTYDTLQQYPKALDYQQRGLSIAQQYGDNFYIASILGGIGETYVHAATNNTGKGLKELFISKPAALHKGIEHLSKAIDLLRAQGSLDLLAKFYSSRSRAYESLGDGISALKDYKSFIIYRDSVFSFEEHTKIANLETDRALQIKDKQIEIDKMAVTKKRNERGFFVVGILLLLAVVFFVARERKRSEQLLLNILPPKIALRLKQRDYPIADAFPEASIMFIDMVNFTSFTLSNDPKIIVSTLNDIFTRFDVLAEQHGLEKIKTIGDCYMAVAGLPQPHSDHAKRAAAMAIGVRQAMANYTTPDGARLSFRIGIHCGPVVAGVIGRRKFIYDLWGNAVNIASRMESTGLEGEIHCTDHFREAVGRGYRFSSRGKMDVKGIGEMETWIMREGL